MPHALRPSALVPRGFMVESAVRDGATTLITIRYMSRTSICSKCGTSSERVPSPLATPLQRTRRHVEKDRRGPVFLRPSVSTEDEHLERKQQRLNSEQHCMDDCEGIDDVQSNALKGAGLW
jgi:hypothetical protein